MWRRLLGAVGVVALLSLTSFVVLQDIVAQAEATSGALVPVAQERTLLERIHLAALNMTRNPVGPERDASRDQLRGFADDLTAIEAAFLGPAERAGNSSRMPGPVRDLYL